MAVGRFQVMAMLQAARAFELGLPMETALSWGLNRAIFYAAAKRGFKGSSSTSDTHRSAKPGTLEPEVKPYPFGDEVVNSEDKDGKTYFVIGGKPQMERDFDKQIGSRFGGFFPTAWDEALDYVRQFDKNVLLSGNEFFSTVYRPKRDEFATKWSEMSTTTKTRARSRS